MQWAFVGAVIAILGLFGALAFLLGDRFKPESLDPYAKALYEETRYQSDFMAREHCLKLKVSTALITCRKRLNSITGGRSFLDVWKRLRSNPCDCFPPRGPSTTAARTRLLNLEPHWLLSLLISSTSSSEALPGPFLLLLSLF